MWGGLLPPWVTNKEEYGKRLEENIENLIVRMKKFSYKPYPVRRAYVPEGNGKMRGMGIPSFEDKVVQGVFKEILEAIYEPKFKEFSYGFRPNKSCHDAIQRVNKHVMADKVNYIVDADMKGFFDNIDHEWMIKFLEHDIADKNFIRYIKRFLIGGSHGRRKAAGNRIRNGARRADFASACKCVPALYVRHVV